jgi:hypothetical protein
MAVSPALLVLRRGDRARGALGRRIVACGLAARIDTDVIAGRNGKPEQNHEGNTELAHDLLLGSDFGSAENRSGW